VLHPAPHDKNRLADRETVTMTLPEAETGKLLRQAHRAYNTEINDILLAALGMAVRDWAGINRLLINLEGHGREAISENATVSRTVGWFTSQFPVALDLTRSNQCSYFLKRVKETLRKIPRRGIGYGILRYLAPVENEALAVEPPINFNYLGQFGQESSGADSIFTFSRCSAGGSVNPGLKALYRLDINGMTTAGQLTLSVNYNKYEYDRAGIEKLADLYRSRLMEIIAHCCDRDECELTPSDLDYKHFSIDELDEWARGFRRQNRFIENIYRLSPMQAGMFYHYLASSDPSLYFEQYEIGLAGQLDREALEKSLELLQQRYDVLRTVFVREGTLEPLQIVLKGIKPAVEYRDLSGLPGNEQGECLTAFKQEDRERGFDLAAGPPMRVSLLKTAGDTYTAVWSFHHMVMDGWCMGIIFKDLLRLYVSLREQQPLELEPAPPYGEFIKWLERRDRQKDLEFWRDYLAGYEQAAGLPKSREAVEGSRFSLAEYAVQVDEQATAGLTRLAAGNQVTLNTLFQALWGILLQKINGTEDAAFGAVVSGRPNEIEDVDRMVGLFINTVPVRVTRTGDSRSLSGLLHQVRQGAISARPHEYVPLAEIESLSPLKNRLIDHIMIFENYPVQEELKALSRTGSIGFAVQSMDVFEQTNYDFNLMVIPGETVMLRFSYNPGVYDGRLIEKIAGYFMSIIEQVQGEEDIDIDRLELFSRDGREPRETVFDEESGDFDF
jgi:non-ribosomal peptide synthase protein (TIGR01720 family)